MGSHFMDLRAAAALLHMDPRELKHFAQRGEVPAKPRGDDFLFERRLLDEWAQRRLVSLSRKQLSGEHAAATVERRRARGNDCHVAELLPEGGVSMCLTARNRGGVIRDMTDLADATGLLYDPATLFAELTAREEAASTAVGGGAAFLHPKFNDPFLFQEPFIAFARAERPVFFGSLDGEGTDLFFLICSPDRALHLHILARLCILAHGSSLLGDLRAAPDEETIRSALKSAEDNYLSAIV